MQYVDHSMVKPGGSGRDPKIGSDPEEIELFEGPGGG